MKVQFELTIGENKFTLIEDVETHTDFFKKLNFYSSLPKTGPGGETDLVLRHRVATTKEGKKVDYYSIVSEKAKQEFKFGQSQGLQGGLFPKGWEPLYNANSSGDDAQDGQSQGLGSASAGTSVGLGATQTPAPAAQQTQAPKTQTAGLGASKPAAAKTTTAPQNQTQNTQANTQVQQQASNILAKFGI